MVLSSPGVEVTVIDQSQYLPAPTNSIPFILLATASNKADPTSTATAVGTTAANANKLFRITSQRDLVTLYGNPFFYSTSNGTPIQGYELNEYGLLAAYSALGITNSVYCLRADIDLASLVGQTGRPTGAPADGTYWLDTTNTTWGINQFNEVTGQFTLQSPIVISDTSYLTGSYPSDSIGSIGDYAVVAIPETSYSSATTAGQFFYKTTDNTWVILGTRAWMADIPTVQGSVSDPTLTAGNVFTIGLSGRCSFTITVPNSPDNDVEGVAALINAKGYSYVSAAVLGGKLTLYSSQESSVPAWIGLTSSSGTALADMGLTAGNHYQPVMIYGTSAQQPLWQSGQTYARPSGSVWIKVGSAGNGLNPAISLWDSSALSWVPKTSNFATSDWGAIYTLDSTGGKAIPAGTVYTQYAYNTPYIYGYENGPIYYWERIATGPTVVTGTVTEPDFTSGPYILYVAVSEPGSSTLSSPYTVTVGDNSDATDFVTAWSAASIPYTTATVTDTGAIQLTHTEGGVLSLNDHVAATGISNGLLDTAGFIVGETAGCKYGPYAATFYQPTAVASIGTGLQISVGSNYQTYFLDETPYIEDGGSGYSVGDTVTFLGTGLGGTTPANDLVVKVNSVSSGAVTSVAYVSGTGAPNYMVQLSNWVEFEMTANEGAPVEAPANNTNWFFSVVDEVDFMVNTSAGWKGYRNVSYDSNGFPQPSGTPATDPAGPLVSATEPTVQSDGTALVYGDIWIDTSDLENYPVINRWQSVNSVDTWVRIDNSDQTSSTGVVFADARWATSGSVNPASDPIPTIVSLLTSNYTDLDVIDDNLYPVGMLLFNTRRSGYNVKQYRVNYFNAASFPDQSLPTEKDAWVSVSGLQSNGAPYMGRKAQRAMVVIAMRSAIDSNTAIRDEDNYFNLIAAPNYPELQPNMVVLNADRGETGFIIGDTPMRLPDDATAIQAWATNAVGATSTGEDGLVTRNTYLGLFYPSGLTNDLSGNLVAVPPSHMMIRTILNNDRIAYPWLAPAGTRRGTIDNATNIGYIDAATGEFQVIKTRIGIRDVLYTNQINPLVFFTGNGLLNFGNKVSFDSSSALDRINVARLVAYLRRQLTLAARPFIFEPNDSITRQQITGVVQTLMVDLVAKRGVYDYYVQCDDSNNTPARIDRNELWIDVACEPTKALEYVFIPIRIYNTGEISAIR